MIVCVSFTRFPFTVNSVWMQRIMKIQIGTVFTQKNTHIHMYMFMCMHACMHACMHNMYVYTCVYIYVTCM